MGTWKHDISKSLIGHLHRVNMVLSVSHPSHPADHGGDIMDWCIIQCTEETTIFFRCRLLLISSVWFWNKSLVLSLCDKGSLQDQTVHQFNLKHRSKKEAGMRHVPHSVTAFCEQCSSGPTQTWSCTWCARHLTQPWGSKHRALPYYPAPLSHLSVTLWSCKKRSCCVLVIFTGISLLVRCFLLRTWYRGSALFIILWKCLLSTVDNGNKLPVHQSVSCVWRGSELQYLGGVQTVDVSVDCLCVTLTADCAWASSSTDWCFSEKHVNISNNIS